ncbi:hypothetical protein CRYUN_Cryun05aG0119400 [Craigia yunnanensis]
MQMRHLLFAAVLVTVGLLVSGQPNNNFAFYKLSLQWPPSVCNAPNFKCKPDILTTFTIHGLWPQLADDTPVPAYDEETNRCTDVTPTSPDQILVDLQPIEERLRKVWPNLRNHQTLNKVFWKHEWKLHGMCSDYPDSPYNFFNAGLTLATNYINPFEGTSITPRENLYEAKHISEAIKKKVGKYPEIACNRVGGTLQLKEIRLCFERSNPPSVLRDCPNKYSNACSNDFDDIRFTPPPLLTSP